MRAEILAIATLVGRRLIRILGIRQYVLFDDEPSRIPDVCQLGQHLLDIDITVAEGAERLAAPDLLDRCRLGDDLLQRGRACVLEVDLVDPPGPVAYRLDRVTTPQQQVPGIETETHIAQLEQPLDL